MIEESVRGYSLPSRLARRRRGVSLLLTLTCFSGGCGPSRSDLEGALRTDLNTFRKAIDLYKADKGHYPVDLKALVDEGYLRSIPPDPFTKRTDTWIPVRKQLDPDAVPGEAGGEAQEPGVMDVRSGAEGISLEGIPYGEF